MKSIEIVRKFIEITANKIGWGKDSKDENSIIWEGQGTEEVGIRADTNEVVIKIDKRYFRPTDVPQPLGDSTKAYKKLNWKSKISLEELIEEMLEVDKKEALKEINLKNQKSRKNKNNSLQSQKIH